MTTVTAESPALIAEIHVAVGDEIASGGILVSTELMKMRHDIRAPHDGIVKNVHVTLGQELAGGEALVTLTPATVTAVSAPEATADDERLSEYHARMALLEDAARPEAVAKRHAKGFRTARENLADLFDAESFVEYGALAVAAQRSKRPLETLNAQTPADGIICGTGTVVGRPVAALAVDYTVLAGTQGYFHHKKMDRLIDVAGRQNLPIVLFAEGGGGRPNDHDTEHLVAAGLNITSFRHFARHRGPKIGIAAGYCFAGNAALFGVCDLRIATEQSFIGMGGPAMIEGGGLGVVAPTEIGPSAVQTRTGVIDLLTANEAGAVRAAKIALALTTPDNAPPHDPEPLRGIIPADRRQAYAMRDVITALADAGSFLELRRDFGIGMITGFLRIEGRAMGLVANNPLHLGGAIDAPAGDKAARFLQLCDAWGLPVLSLCDTPGFMVGPEVEATGQVAHISRLFLAGAHFGQPLVTVILRKAYGLGAMAMAGGGFDRPDYCCAWPSGEIGAMGLEGAVRLGYRDHLAALPEEARAVEFQRLLDEMITRGKALNAASLLEFDAVIDPAETRAKVTAALKTAGPCTPGNRYVDAF